MTAPVSLLLVSHSHELAEGLKDLAGQMAPSVHIGAVGGLPDGGLGTSFDQIAIALEAAFETAAERSVAIFADLGSAVMAVESVLELMSNVGPCQLVYGPFVEGAVAAAVTAQQGAGLAAVVAAGEEAGKTWASVKNSETKQVTARQAAASVVGTATVVDAVGIHARPAAELAKLAGTFHADISINGVDAKSVLQVMTLGVRFAETVKLEASGSDAQEAIDTLTAAISEGFDK